MISHKVYYRKQCEYKDLMSVKTSKVFKTLEVWISSYKNYGSLKIDLV